MVFVMTPYMRIRHKIEGIEGNRAFRAGEIRRNPTTIGLTKFFFPTSSWVWSGLTGFERVAVLAIGLVWKGAVDD